MINDMEDEVTEELFQSRLCRCQSGFRTLLKDSDLIVLIGCVTNVIQKFGKVVDHIWIFLLV